MKTACILTALVGSTAAFTAPTFSRPSTSLNGGSSGYATSIPGKSEKIEAVQGLLESSEMVFSVPASSLTVAEVQELRRAVPEGTTISVVKNTLFGRAVAGTDYEEAAGDLLKGANMWFFIEEDIGASVKAWNTFCKDNNKKETHGIVGGIVEGVAYDAAGVDQISKLPSKIELITKVAAGIKAVPTKVARVIKAPGEKVARAIKLATDEDDSE